MPPIHGINKNHYILYVSKVIQIQLILKVIKFLRPRKPRPVMWSMDRSQQLTKNALNFRLPNDKANADTNQNSNLSDSKGTGYALNLHD